MYDVTMPKLSDSMEEGKIIEWKVKEGDAVKEGDVLAEVESDKATMELECFHDGVIGEIVKGDGAEVPVGEVIARIAGKAEEPKAGKRAPEEKEKKPEKKAETPAGTKKAPEEAKAEEEATSEKEEAEEEGKETRVREVEAKEEGKKGGRVAISPYARKLAEKKGVDYTRLKGSGPGGRIIARDIEEAAKDEAPEKTYKEEKAPANEEKNPDREEMPKARREAEAEPAARVLAEKRGVDLRGLEGTGTGGRITVEDVKAASAGKAEAKPRPVQEEKLPALETGEDEAEVEDAPFRLKTQARRVTASKRIIPHFYLTCAAEVTALMSRVEGLKKEQGATLTQLVMLAVLKVLEKHPEINRSYDQDRVIRWKNVNLGLAVQTDQGLTVAVVPKAQKLSFKELVERSRAVIERARNGKLTSEDRRHATFTISNLGMFHVEQFESIINPPSSVTLAVASVLDVPVVKDGKVQPGKVMKLTASCDHRIVDGVTAARFMSDLQLALEHPDDLLIQRES